MNFGSPSCSRLADALGAVFFRAPVPSGCTLTIVLSAEQLSQAEAENMPRRHRPRLGEVSLALIELGKQS